jgi:hypothetical protein
MYVTHDQVEAMTMGEPHATAIWRTTLSGPAVTAAASGAAAFAAWSCAT